MTGRHGCASSTRMAKITCSRLVASSHWSCRREHAKQLKLPAAIETMVLKIEKDHQRFRQIVKGRIREDLRKFLTKGELIGKEGKHLISIPVRGIDVPHFRYGDNSGGVGAGDGKEGDVVGKGQPGAGKSQ